MIRKQSTLAGILAALVLGVLTVNPASAASRWSDISSVTNRGTAMVHPKAGGLKRFSRTDLSAVTHRSAGGEAREIGHYARTNSRAGDLTTVTHRN